MLEEEERLQNEEMELEDEDYSPSPSPQPTPAKPIDVEYMETELSPPTPDIDQLSQQDGRAQAQEQQEVVTASADQASTSKSTLANNRIPIAPAPASKKRLVPSRAASTRDTTAPTREDDLDILSKRRENHRLVERRRRDAINKGINELAEAIPDCPKKRSTVITKAIEHISDLKRFSEQVCRERDVLKEQNQLLVNEIAEKNKKINELLLLI